MSLAALLAACAPAPRTPLFGGLPSVVDEAEPASPAPASRFTATALPAPTPTPQAAPLRTATAPAPGFWPRLRSRFAVPGLAGPEVAQYRQAYGARPDFLMRVLQRGAPYLPAIGQRLEQARLPADLALLPIIESGFDVHALSPAAAAGLWQFVPETGRRYGLPQTWLRDARRDPLAATDAALAYLADLHRQFGDWQLALAAYNCGEGCVARAISQARSAGRAADFSSISPWLPAETRGYVPRFVAVRDILLSPEAWGVNLPSLDRAPALLRNTLNTDADLDSIARLADISRSDLMELNAGVLRQVVPAGDALWLPEPQTQRLAARLAAAGEARVMALKPVRANPMEPLAAFAARQRTTPAVLRDINGIAASLQTIRSGTLFVPLSGDETAQPLDVAVWPPLHMVGEEALAPKPFAGSKRDQELLATHPQWVESGWTPGRLQLPGRRGTLVRPPSAAGPAP